MKLISFYVIKKKEKNEIFTLMNYSVYIIGAIINTIF